MNLNLGNSKIFCQLCYKFAFGQKKMQKMFHHLPRRKCDDNADSLWFSSSIVD